MRSCIAGVIHVQSEGECLDTAGNRHLRINENVLIEIGAAMALYGKRVILLAEKASAFRPISRACIDANTKVIASITMPL
jgi:hypothetical protein